MLTPVSIEQLCRICLRQLLQFSEENQSTISGSYNARSVPHLANLLRQFFGVDVFQQPAAFPQHICNLCYHALLQFHTLCEVAQQSTERLEQLASEAGAADSWPDSKSSITHTTAEVVEIETLVKDEPIDSEDNEEAAHNDDITAASAESISATEAAAKLRRRKLLACHQCGKQAYKLPYLEAHIRSVHEGHTKPFLCGDCSKCFTRYEQLRSHMRNTHAANDGGGGSSEELICEQCNRKYSTKNALGEHLKRHAQHKTYVCEHCGVAKVTRTELLTHLRIHNPDWAKFKCQQCPQLFRHKSAISRHVRVVHEGQRRFQCAHCQKRFGTHASQQRHERLHAGNQRE